MNASPFMTFPKTFSQLLLMGLGVLLLSSCSNGKVVGTAAVNPAALEVKEPAASQESAGVTQASALPDATAQPVLPNQPVEAESVAAPAPTAPVELAIASPSAPAEATTDAPALLVAAQPSEVPVSFQGLWSPNPETGCSPLSEGRLLIEPNRLTFYESSGAVVEVAVQGTSEVMVTTEMSGEGSTWTDTKRLQLSAENSSLTVNGFGPRYRCPDGAAEMLVSEAIASEPSQFVPAQFQGIWNSSLEQCSSGGGDGRLKIEPDFISFHESSGPIVEVAIKGQSEVTLTAEMSGEGSTWMKSTTFQLASDGSSLVDADYPDNVRIRCS